MENFFDDNEIILPDSYLKQGGDKTINKLIMLFLFDKMEVPITESTVLDILSVANTWIPYMDCKPLIPELVEASFLYEIKTSHTEPLFSITTEGTSCLGHFYTRIPLSLREVITTFVKDNKMKYKRKQEYDSDFYKNDDGSYTVLLKIIDTVKPMLRIEFTVPTKDAAKNIHKNWENKASNVYLALYDLLME